jgi:hypothetical protein
MEDFEARQARALALWDAGEGCVQAGDRAGAYAKFTCAHDLIMDCPRLHLAAHRHLREVTRYHRDPREFWTDTVLIWLAPFGIFEALAFAMRSGIWRTGVCQHETE